MTEVVDHESIAFDGIVEAGDPFVADHSARIRILFLIEFCTFVIGIDEIFTGETDRHQRCMFMGSCNIKEFPVNGSGILFEGFSFCHFTGFFQPFRLKPERVTGNDNTILHQRIITEFEFTEIGQGFNSENITQITVCNRQITENFRQTGGKAFVRHYRFQFGGNGFEFCPDSVPFGFCGRFGGMFALDEFRRHLGACLERFFRNGLNKFFHFCVLLLIFRLLDFGDLDLQFCRDTGFKAGNIFCRFQKFRIVLRTVFVFRIVLQQIAECHKGAFVIFECFLFFFCIFGIFQLLRVRGGKIAFPHFRIGGRRCFNTEFFVFFVCFIAQFEQIAVFAETAQGRRIVADVVIGTHGLGNCHGIKDILSRPENFIQCFERGINNILPVHRVRFVKLFFFIDQQVMVPLGDESSAFGLECQYLGVGGIFHTFRFGKTENSAQIFVNVGALGIVAGIQLTAFADVRVIFAVFLRFFCPEIFQQRTFVHGVDPRHVCHFSGIR